ncbi:MAG: hypothetical protein HY321_04140 [Armatimonadetes bacterium]|nr:hypothetical protein [Armatimonadota bacterium]
MVNWAWFPRSDRAPELARVVVEAFCSVSDDIDSASHSLDSNSVLARVAPELIEGGFRVEVGKRREDKLTVPVLFGLNGKAEKSFDADAFHEAGGFVVEVEAGRAVVNNQFLKDLFQACMMQGVECLGIAVRNQYLTGRDFETVVRFLDTLYASNRLSLPLRGVLILGY